MTFPRPEDVRRLRFDWLLTKCQEAIVNGETRLEVGAKKGFTINEVEIAVATMAASGWTVSFHQHSRQGLGQGWVIRFNDEQVLSLDAAEASRSIQRVDMDAALQEQEQARRETEQETLRRWASQPPVLPLNTPVRTLVSFTDGDWEAQTARARRWGVYGRVQSYSPGNGHGAYYSVIHTDGSEALYDPRELAVVDLEVTRGGLEYP